MSLPSQLLGMSLALAFVTGVTAAPVSVEVQPDRVFNRLSGIGETLSEQAREGLIVAACFFMDPALGLPWARSRLQNICQMMESRHVL